eukprot:3631591-Karenia_brevis.AAC.1
MADGGYQGVCWKCGVKGHKSYEWLNGTMIQGVDSEGGVDKPTVNIGRGIMKEACSIEKTGFKGWCVGAVTKSVSQNVPKHVRREVNRFERLVEDDEDEEEIPPL